MRARRGRAPGCAGLARLAANLVPVAGVFVFDWDVFPLVLLFWLENVIVGGFPVLRSGRGPATAARARSS